MDDIRFLTGKEVVQANHIVAFCDQTFTEVGAKKTGAASHENAFRKTLLRHRNSLFGWLSANPSVAGKPGRFQNGAGHLVMVFDSQALRRFASQSPLFSRSD
jgi:hypothetical protein